MGGHATREQHRNRGTGNAGRGQGEQRVIYRLISITKLSLLLVTGIASTCYFDALLLFDPVLCIPMYHPILLQVRAENKPSVLDRLTMLVTPLGESLWAGCV